jgi:hypothetical protein
MASNQINPTLTLGTQPTGELAALDSSVGSSGYSYEILRYPYDLGNSDTQHYVMFYINLPQTSKYDVSETVGANMSASSANYDLVHNLTQSNGGLISGKSAAAATLAQGAVATIQGTLAAAGGKPQSQSAGAQTIELGVAAAIATQINLKPKLNRIKSAIAIYMPDTIISDFRHDYQTVSVTEALGKVGNMAAMAAGGANVISAGIEKLSGGNANFGDAVKKSPSSMEALGQVANMTGAVGAGFTDLAVKSAGFAVNPQVELLYKGTDNRSFVFEFKFQPRSKAEALAIRKIIYTFRRFAAPELAADSMTNGRYFIPPGQFDIKFKFNNTDNTNLFNISTCVLTGISTNYSSAGQFATFDDGMPVEISLQLQFKEADIIYRDLIEQFGY